ncbi:glutamate racemase [Paucimonas lemoignei]|uniref:Glutamate racemase n=1 Tax=Paucimonas lemoignei TaxID=29443 RepID=A0A4R3HT68_PAULE|nr:glutamate racemase [Paucimonas lemoignei]TCS34712.1 glutamate racemase [Paucimonas lemoignei]
MSQTASHGLAEKPDRLRQRGASSADSSLRPIGVFDSGIGGLSVLRHICKHLPNENLLYFADSGFAPYGGKPVDVIVARTMGIAEFLLSQGAKALVVACNTATAASIKALRERYPALPVVGVEPGLKPAAAISKTRKVGVLATERTLASEKFQLLREQISSATSVEFLSQACKGLADQVEKGELHSPATLVLLNQYVTPLLREGVDTLVLGCTHYPFVQPAIETLIRQISAHPVEIIDTGEAVARQLGRQLELHGLRSRTGEPGALQAFTTGSRTALAQAFGTLLHLNPEISAIQSEAAG